MKDFFSSHFEPIAYSLGALPVVALILLTGIATLFMPGLYGIKGLPKRVIKKVII